MTARSASCASAAAGRQGARLLAGALALVALACAVAQLAAALPVARWIGAAFAPDDSVAELVFHFSVLPRLAVAALAGAALAAAGTIFQHVLDNPLASPVTLGVAGGAQLAMSAATLFTPAFVAVAPDGIAFAGGLAALGVTLLVAAPGRFAPTILILAGLAIGLFCGAMSAALRLFNGDYLTSVLSWSGGAFAQTDWSVTTALLPRLAVLFGLMAALLRPMTVLGLGEEARGLGLPAGTARIATLAVAVGFAAVVTAEVGLVGFVEIAAPLAVRLAGGRRLSTRLLLGPPVGAALLVIVDALVQAGNARFGLSLSTGGATGLAVAPLLLWLAPRLRNDPRSAVSNAMGDGPRRSPVPLLIGLAGLALLAALGSVVLGGVPDLSLVLSWRLPRTGEAFAAGTLLGAAGAILQRTTGNPLASPEVLGLGTAVMAGFALVLALAPAPTAPLLAASGTAGAAGLVALLALRGWRSGFAPDQLLVVGVALTAGLDAGLSVFLSTDDPRASLLLGWMAGTTAGAQQAGAWALLVAAIVLVSLGLGFVRSLSVLPLGDATARGLGLALGPVRAALMGLVALMTSAAVLAVGPLTFVGLLGPHLARRLGLQGAAAHLLGSALMGGLVMTVADGLGRVLFSPFELPAGLAAALIGCPFLIVLLRRRG